MENGGTRNNSGCPPRNIFVFTCCHDCTSSGGILIGHNQTEINKKTTVKIRLSLSFSVCPKCSVDLPLRLNNINEINKIVSMVTTAIE